jgi:uncharacterized protein YbaR (Trm112 family)
VSLDHRLISLLVCPVCKGPLELLRDAEAPDELVLPGRPAGLPHPRRHAGDAGERSRR